MKLKELTKTKLERKRILATGEACKSTDRVKDQGPANAKYPT